MAYPKDRERERENYCVLLSAHGSNIPARVTRSTAIITSDGSQRQNEYFSETHGDRDQSRSKKKEEKRKKNSLSSPENAHTIFTGVVERINNARHDARRVREQRIFIPMTKALPSSCTVTGRELPSIHRRQKIAEVLHSVVLQGNAFVFLLRRRVSIRYLDCLCNAGPKNLRLLAKSVSRLLKIYFS